MSRNPQDTIPYQQIAGWFDRALGSGSPRPSRLRLNQLARQLQVFLNRANNKELEQAGPVPLEMLRDVSPKEWRDRKIRNVAMAAQKLCAAITELEEFSGDVLPTPSRDVSLPELRDTLRELMLFSIAAKLPRRARGQPLAAWRDPGIGFAIAVRDAMREINYRGRLSLSDPESVPVVVAAAAMSWAYKRKLEASGFVSAMRNRKRGKDSEPSVLNAKNSATRAK